MHDALIVVRDRPAAAAKHLDVIRAALLQLLHHFGEKLDVPAVVTGDTDRRDILLDRRAHDVLHVTMKPEIHDLDAVPDELEIDRVDRAVVTIANRNGGENADRGGHEWQILAAIACRATRFPPKSTLRAVNRPLHAIALTGLIVGTLDITSALILTFIRGGTPTRLFQFIASGLLGPRAFQGGPSSAALGLFLHYVIAFGVVIVFWFIFRNLPFARTQTALSGILYGAIVFAVMNLVVLPLSAARPRHALVPDLIQIAIHMFIIGLPTALLLRSLFWRDRSLSAIATAYD